MYQNVEERGGEIYITTTYRKEIGEICLPPCIARQQMIFDTSEDEKAVRITVKTSHSCTSATKQAEKTERNETNEPTLKRQSIFFVKPELRVPKQEDTSAAVAETKPESASADGPK